MARLFDATNDEYIEVGDISALDLTGDTVTLSAWIKLASTVSEGKIIAKWSDAGGAFSYLTSTDGGDMCLFAINASSQKNTVGTTALAADTWHHIAGVYDGSEMRVYCNGVEENSISQTGNMSSNTAPVRIGAGSGGSGGENPVDGDIGHCAIWDVALTDSEVKTLAAGIPPLQVRQGEGLLFYAPLNGQDPEYDVVGGLDLTVNGPIKTEEPPIPNSIVAP